MVDNGIIYLVGTYVAGVLTGIIVESVSNLITDRRHDREAKSDERKQFLEIVNQMPDLIVEMKNDLLGNKFVREFFLSKRSLALNTGDDPCFIYYEDEHPGLQNKIHVLENLRYIKDITPKNAPMYRMTEDFVRLILTYG